MSNKILIVEDDAITNCLINEALTNAGYQCTQAFSGTECLLCMDREEYRLILLDLVLPGLNGEEILPQLRKKQNCPIIILSAKDSVDTKCSLLDYGAEDYITKPFDLRELISRVGVQLRKNSGKDIPNNQLRYKSLSLFLDTYTVMIHNYEVKFTKQEFKIMELLVSNQKRVFSKQDIYDYAWDDQYMGEDKTINVHISNIRKKLKDFSDEEYIETVWGIGFRLAK